MAGQSRTGRAVVAISSHVAVGAVGNRGAVFALERFGYGVWSVPTVILPYHPGHGRTDRIVAGGAAFAKLLDELADSPWAGDVAAVMTGYMASEEQVQAVSRFMGKLKSRQKVTCLCDPVIGDSGRLFVDPAIAGAIRDHLVPLADIVTPNVFELAWLVGQPLPGDIAGAVRLATYIGADSVAVTSVPAGEGQIANVLIEPATAIAAAHRRIKGPANGAGDIFAATFLARRLAGKSSQDALVQATECVASLYMRAARSGNSELQYQRDWDLPRLSEACVELSKVKRAPIP